jgi:hypothetical protein
MADDGHATEHHYHQHLPNSLCIITTLLPFIVCVCCVYVGSSHDPNDIMTGLATPDEVLNHLMIFSLPLPSPPSPPSPPSSPLFR